MDAGNMACGTPNGETTYINLRERHYFMRIHVGSIWGKKHIETKSADQTDKFLNFSDPRFYSMIRLCD
jgi:hypothetical protein